MKWNNKKGSWNAMNELTPNNLEINRHIEKLDAVAVRFESKWGPDVLPSLVSPELAAKWKSQCDKLNDAIQRGDLPQVADLVSGCIRGYTALDAAAIANGHKPEEGTFFEARSDAGTIYRVALTDVDARRAAKDGVVVYTMAEIVRLLEPMQLVNKVKGAFPGATVENVRGKVDWKQGDALPF
jgi:hypothetical protein